MLYFDEAYYLLTKTAQLNKSGTKAPDGKAWTVESTAKAMADASLTPEQHFHNHARDEGLNPNAWFNEYEYLIAKTNQLNADRAVKPGGTQFTPWTVKETLAAILNAGMTPAEHYERHGAFETDADGNFLNPSNVFDANAYMAAKLAMMQREEPDGGHTMASMLAAFQECGFSPVSHYMAHGASEATAGKTPMVQTVPMIQRVENDPGRASITGEILPANYNSPGQLADPSDVGGLVPDSISPPVLTGPTSPLNPGDEGYTPPPANVRDTAANPLIALSATVNGTAGTYWLAVDRDNGRALVLGADGAILGWVDITITASTGAASTGTVTPAALANPAAAERDGLPASVTVNENLNNNFTPDPPTGGIYGGTGDDTIIVGSGGSVTGNIYGGTGADTIILKQGDLTVYQRQGDSGDFTLPGSGDTVSAADFDVVDLTAAGSVNVKIDGLFTLNPGVSLSPITFTNIESLGLSFYNNQAFVIQGKYNDNPHILTFTADIAGTDYLLVYDCDTSAALDFEAVVIVGSSGGFLVSGDVIGIS